jgi:deazaflavin-dependent oxidoreductase (nitroreductase family)
MTDGTSDVARWLERSASEQYAYLTTTGRRTGRPHRIEIWFATENGRVYLLSGGGERADWVRNLRETRQVTVDLRGETRTGAARVLLSGTDEDQRARELLVGKYREGDNLDEWGRTSLAVVLEFEANEEISRVDE